MEMMKMWKGLFYCLWMCDKLQNQQDLSERISQFLLLFVSPARTKDSDKKVIERSEWEIGLRFLKAFWTTMQREWHTLDHHRLNKFYHLSRKMMEKTAQFMEAYEWNMDMVDAVCDLLLTNGGPLDTTGEFHNLDQLQNNSQTAVIKSPVGIQYLIVETYTTLLHSEKEGMKTAAKISLLQPILILLITTHDTRLIEKIQTSIFDPICHNGGEDDEHIHWPKEHLVHLARVILSMMDDEEGVRDEMVERLAKVVLKVAAVFDGGFDEVLALVNDGAEDEQGEEQEEEILNGENEEIENEEEELTENGDESEQDEQEEISEIEETIEEIQEETTRPKKRVKIIESANQTRLFRKSDPPSPNKNTNTQPKPSKSTKNKKDKKSENLNDNNKSDKNKDRKITDSEASFTQGITADSLKCVLDGNVHKTPSKNKRRGNKIRIIDV